MAYVTYLVAVLLTAATGLWPTFWPTAPSVLKVVVVLTAAGLPLVVPAARHREARTLIKVFSAFLRLHYVLAAAIVILVMQLLVLSLIPEEPSVTFGRLLVASLIAGTTAGLVSQSARHTPLRIIKGSGDKQYLLEDGRLRHIPDPPTRLFLETDTNLRLERVSDRELSLYGDGAPVPSIANARLVQGQQSRRIYVLWGGGRKRISEEALGIFFPGRDPEPMDDDDLEGLEGYERVSALPPVQLVAYPSEIEVRDRDAPQQQESVR